VLLRVVSSSRLVGLMNGLFLWFLMLLGCSPIIIMWVFGGLDEKIIWVVGFYSLYLRYVGVVLCSCSMLVLVGI